MNPVDQIKGTFGLHLDKQLADLLGVAKSTVADWREKRYVPARHVIKLQKAALQRGLAVSPLLEVPTRAPRDAA